MAAITVAALIGHGDRGQGCKRKRPCCTYTDKKGF
jgi:hypothetical protein